MSRTSSRSSAQSLEDQESSGRRQALSNIVLLRFIGLHDSVPRSSLKIRLLRPFLTSTRSNANWVGQSLKGLYCRRGCEVDISSAVYILV